MTARVRIKICGVRSIEIAERAADCGADAVGLVRVGSSPRFVEAAAATEIAAALPPWITAVAVYADAAPARIIGDWHATVVRPWIQLHGREDRVGAALVGMPIIKALSIDESPETIRRWDEDPLVAALLIDAPVPGAGVPFDHHRFETLRETLRTPIILAGGLDPQNVGDAIRALRPWAVDVSSGVESSRGIKDPARIADFCAAVRDAE